MSDSNKSLSKKLRKIISKFARFMLVVVLTPALVLVLAQQYMILPSLMSKGPDIKRPSNVEELTVISKSGKKINVWHIKEEPKNRKGIILLSTGNYGFVQTSTSLQADFQNAGYSMYTYDYPGTGASEGWPWQGELLEAADSIWEFIQVKEKVSANEIIPMGISFGTGIASHLALQHQVKTLLLIAPYTSISDIVSKRPFLWPLAPFVKLDLPSKNYISSMNKTCIVAAHGQLDDTITATHTEDLEKIYSGKGVFHKIISPGSGHNSIISDAWGEIIANMNLCLVNK